jgi:recombination protein RecT
MGQITKAAEAANTPATLTPKQAIQQQLKTYAPVIEKLLTGTGISQETFVAQIANAYRAQPNLWKCQPETVLGASLRCAQLGLAPNDARNLAWIIPYGQTAQFQLGYGGVMELARRAVPGLRFDGRPVYPNDEFDLDYGKADPLTHRPSVVRGMDRGGDAYAWYVRAVYPDGAVQIHVLDREGVEYHRKFSKQQNGDLWTKSYDAAALKSVVLDMKRWLPSSTQLVAAFASDEQVIDVRQADTIEATYERVPDVDVDTESGEILTPEVVS